MYVLKLAFRPWRLAPFSQIFSALAVGCLLLLAGFLIWLEKGLSPVLSRLEGEQVITAYLKPNLNDKAENEIVNQIQMQLGAQRITELKKVGPAQFVDHLKKQYPDLGRELEDLGPEMTEVVPRFISVSGVFADHAAEDLKKISGVETIETLKDQHKQTVGAFSTLRWVVRVLMIGTCFALFTGLIHLSRMNAYLHRDALILLKFWGAGRGTLLAPGALSGLFVGIVGGGIGWATWTTLGVWLTRHVREFSSALNRMPLPPAHLSAVLLIFGMIGGVLAGYIGSVLAAHLKTEGAGA